MRFLSHKPNYTIILDDLQNAIDEEAHFKKEKKKKRSSLATSSVYKENTELGDTSISSFIYH